MLEFRVFISSPGDAAIERRRAENVVSRLNGENAGLARFTTVRWETEFYKAHTTFQTQIPPAVDCEIVVGILKWRLGTELPPDFEHAPDGEAYPSGTAYELLTAIEKRRGGAALPDVFVFRFTGGAPNPRLDDPTRAQVERDWSNLRGFLERWFVSRQGHFLAALNSYGSEDDFEHQLESLLRRWLAEKVAGGRVVRWPATRGSPFRGLDAFGARHASVFFGRASEVRRAIDTWRDRAAQGTAFLLVVGGSGAGKSSLARAGLLPRLTTPGVVPAVDRWRIAVMRPGDSPRDPFMSLATALLQTESDLSADEEGRGAALPEITEGDCRTPADLAAVLAHADVSATRTIINALARIGERTKSAEGFSRDVRCDLVLLIDQLDELFDPSVPSDVRSAFARLMSALVATGRVWLAATLRADLYAALIAMPELKQLKDRGASFDLAPPGSAELVEIVREPAAAAALTFESDPATGERLDERLLREADRPDMLPLLQLALSRIWEARETQGAETVLPLSALEKLGGLQGIVAEAGETALAKLGETERDRLPRLIRQLAEHRRGGPAEAVNVRAVPLAEATPDPAGKTLVDALVAARLLTLSGDSGAATVRLAHQRVLKDWPRAAEIVTDSTAFYRVRAEVEEQRRRWEAGNRRGELLLARGLPLAEARNMAARYAAEIEPQTQAFIAASRRRANRAQTLGWTAAAVFALVAVGAGVAAKIALDEKRQAQENFGVAQGAINGLVYNVGEGLQDVSGLQIDAVRKILGTSQEAIDNLSAITPDNRELQRSRMAMLRRFSTIYVAAGDVKDALPAARQGVEIARRLVAQVGDVVSERDLTLALSTLGDVELRVNDPAAALSAYEEALRLTRRLVARGPGVLRLQEDLAAALRQLGKAKAATGDRSGALADWQDALAVARKIAEKEPGNVAAVHGIGVALFEMGDLEAERGAQIDALADFKESLSISRQLAARDPSNKRFLRDISIGLSRIGDLASAAGDRNTALANASESLGVLRRLLAADPNDASARADVAAGLNTLGTVQASLGDRKAALADIEESLGLLRDLAGRDTLNFEAQRNVVVGLENVGSLRRQLGDRAGARVAYQDALASARKLAATKPDDPRVLDAMTKALEVIGDLRSEAGDRAGAAASYQGATDVLRALAARDAGRTRDLAMLLSKRATAELEGGDRKAANDHLAQSLALTQARAASRPRDPQAQRDLWSILAKIGGAAQADGRTAEALAADEKALAVARALESLAPADRRTQSILQVTLRVVGSLAFDTGDKAKARSAYRSALTVTRRIVAGDLDSAKNLRDLLSDVSMLARIEKQLGDAADAHQQAEGALAIVRKLTASASDVQSKLLLVSTLWLAGELRKDTADLPGAVAAFEEALPIERKLVADQTNTRLKPVFAIMLGEAAYAEILAKDYAKGLTFTDEAIAANPQLLSLDAIRGYALMMLGHGDEARGLLLKHRGALLQPGMTWEQGVTADLADLRKAGLTNTLMDEIEATLGKAAAPAASR